jgi:hypothetical protein
MDSRPASRDKPAEKPEIARMVTIVLDPGHGGEDPGAIGRGGSREKDVTLSIARRLKEKIDAQPNMRSLLTRDGDFFIPLHQRVGKNMDVNITLATLLMAGTDKQELQEAHQLLEEATQQKPEVAPMTRLYQGEIQVKLGDTAQALKIWKSQLAKIPAGSEQRALFQERIAQHSGK